MSPIYSKFDKIHIDLSQLVAINGPLFDNQMRIELYFHKMDTPLVISKKYNAIKNSDPKAHSTFELFDSHLYDGQRLDFIDNVQELVDAWGFFKDAEQEQNNEK